jgi:hypothetical protein
VIDPELFAYHPQLEKCVDEHAFQARPEAVKAVFPMAEADNGKKPEDVPQEKADAACQQDGKDEGFWRIQGNSFMRVQGSGCRVKKQSSQFAVDGLQEKQISKFEIRSTKSETMSKSKYQMFKTEAAIVNSKRYNKVVIARSASDAAI